MRTVLYTEIDAQCDKLDVDRRKYCQLCSTEDGPVYHTARPPMVNSALHPFGVA